MDIMTRWIDGPYGDQVPPAHTAPNHASRSTDMSDKPTLSRRDDPPSDEERLRAVVDTAMQELDRTIALKRRGQALSAGLRDKLEASLAA